MSLHKHILPRLVLAAMAFHGSTILLCSQETKPGILPVRPAELLKQLPDPQPEWRLTASNARHLPRSRPLSRAFREYIRIPGPEQSLSGPSTPSVVRITILDTVLNSDTSELFRGTAANGRENKLTLNGLPAIRTAVPNETDHVDVLAHDRFLITVVLVGPDSAKVEDWLKQINLEGLKKVSANETHFDPQKDLNFMMERVDELNTKRTRSARFSVAPEEPDQPLGSE